MDIYDLLRVLPLASAATWFVLAGLQVYRDRIHTWTETFFLLSCIFAALYATWDFLFFTAGDKEFAKFAALMSTSSAIVTSQSAIRRHGCGMRTPPTIEPVRA